jgi:hypothetical protein
VGIKKSFPADSDSYRPRSEIETTDTVPTDEQLAQFGFFKRFDAYDGEKVYGPIDDANVLPGVTQTQSGGSDLASENDVQWHMLAEAIPALSYGTGANEVTGMQENLDLESFTNTNWPSSLRGHSEWWHSDYQNVSLNYVIPVFNRMIEIGGLDAD